MSLINAPRNKSPSTKTSLPDRPGFYLCEFRESRNGKDLARYYISDWECHRCNKANPIKDQNRAWIEKGKYQRVDTAERPSPVDAKWVEERCSRADCSHERCDACWDVDALGYRRRYCGGLACEKKFANQGFEAKEWRPYKALKDEEVFEKEGEI